jgi:tellurite resistance protein TerC
MTKDQIVYSVFGIVIAIALSIDLGFLSKKSSIITIRQALKQTFFWVMLALAFFGFLWFEEGQEIGIQYLSGYFPPDDYSGACQIDGSAMRQE